VLDFLLKAVGNAGLLVRSIITIAEIMESLTHAGILFGSINTYGHSN